MVQLDLKKRAICTKQYMCQMMSLFLCLWDFNEQIEKWQDCYSIPLRTVPENSMPGYIMYPGSK